MTETKICPQCHTVNQADYNFCIKCRYAFNRPHPVKQSETPHVSTSATLPSQQTYKKCPRCGHENLEEFRFCMKCRYEFVPGIQVPNLFFEIDHLLQETSQQRQNQAVPGDVVAMLLRNFEKGKGVVYEQAKQELLRTIPLDAAYPLWKMKDKAFLDPNKKKDALTIVREIGGEGVAQLITSDKTGLSSEWADLDLDEDTINMLSSDVADYEKDQVFESILTLAKIKSPTGISWLGERSKLDLLGAFAIKALEQFNHPAVIPALVSNTMFSYTETDHDPDSFTRQLVNKTIIDVGLRKYPELRAKANQRRVLFGVIGAGLQGLAEYHQNRRMKLEAAALVTAPYVPLDFVLSDITNFTSTITRERCRMQAVINLCQRFGLEHLDNTWMQFNPMEPTFRAFFLMGCYLFLGKQHPMMDSVLNHLMLDKLNENSKQAAAIYIADALIKGKKWVNHAAYNNILQRLLMHPEQVISRSVASSILYANYEPLLQLALQQGATCIPALAFSHVFHKNQNAGAILQSMTDAKLMQEGVAWQSEIQTWLE